MQTELFAEPEVKTSLSQAKASLPDISVLSRNFADNLYDYDGQVTRDGLSFRVELYTRTVLAQFGIH